MFNNSKRKNERLHSGVTDTMSVRSYNLSLGLLIFYGFLVNVIMVQTMSDFFMNMHWSVLVVGYFVSCFIGIVMSAASKNAFISFIGYNLVVVPIGAVLSICLQSYSGIDILTAMGATGVVTFIMLILSTIYPNFFAGLGRTLFFSLLAGLIVEIVLMFMGISTPILNWFFVVIFSLYIGYDWYKAQQYPKTMDNAVDSALDIYLDIINLFLRILEIIIGKSDD